MFAETDQYGSWFFPVFEGEGRGARDLAFVVRVDSGDPGHVQSVCERVNVWSRAVNCLSIAETGWASSVVCGGSEVSWVWVDANKMLRQDMFARDVSLLPEMLVRMGQGKLDSWGRGWDAPPIGALYVLTTLDPYLSEDDEPDLPEPGLGSADLVPLDVGPFEGLDAAEVVLCVSDWSMALLDVFRAILGEFFWNDPHQTQPGPLMVAGHPGHPATIRFELHGSRDAGVQLRPDLAGFVNALHQRLQDLTGAELRSARFVSMTARPTS